MSAVRLDDLAPEQRAFLSELIETARRNADRSYRAAMEAAQAATIERQRRALNDTPTFVYRYWAADGTLLYVGMTSALDMRDSGHRTASPWYGEVARRTHTEYADRPTAAAAEAAAITTERPLYNRAGMAS